MFTILITLADDRAPKGKLADAEIVYDNSSEMFGLTLQGFAVWESTRQQGDINVSFPARTYTTRGGERRTFSLLRPVNDTDGPKAQRWLTDLIVASYKDALHDKGNRPQPRTPPPIPAAPPRTPARR